jgi:hypothetical protein
MDDRTFESLIRSLAAVRTRRSAFKGLVGIGASIVTARVLVGDADAARRGFSGPKLPTPTPKPCVDGSAECVVPDGGTSILICEQGSWHEYPCINGQFCISSPDGNDFCEITI